VQLFHVHVVFAQSENEKLAGRAALRARTAAHARTRRLSGQQPRAVKEANRERRLIIDFKNNTALWLLFRAVFGKTINWRQGKNRRRLSKKRNNGMQFMFQASNCVTIYCLRTNQRLKSRTGWKNNNSSKRWRTRWSWNTNFNHIYVAADVLLASSVKEDASTWKTPFIIKRASWVAGKWRCKGCV